MGVYIKKMKMPKKGKRCPFNGYAPRYGHVCFIDVELACRSEDKRSSRCPLIEVKAPHGRLIDADDVNERIRKKLGIRNLDYLLEAEKPIAMSIKESPTVIEAEVE